MKLKSILSILFTALLMMGCSENQVAGSFEELNLSTSYISIPSEGGQAKAVLTAAEDWEFSKEKNNKDQEMYPIPEWLTISQTSGKAGKIDLNFSAEAFNGGREVELKIISGSKSQFLRVRQGDMDATTATCKEVNEAPDGKNFRVSGVVTKIANTTYGNWYMTDGTAELYIYGTLDANGQTKNFLSLGLEVGDKVTIEGPKGSYNGSPQMIDVSVLNIEKSLLKLLSEPAEVAKEGGKLEVRLASKGKGTFFEIADDCSSWISYSDAEFINGVPSKIEPNPADTVVYYFNIAPNSASARNGVISFRANEGEPLEYTFTQNGGIADVTVEAFLNAPVDEAAQYRVVGIVSRVHEKFNNNFWVEDATGEMYAYRVDAQGNTLSVGDFVTVVGKRGAYNDNPQMVGPVLEKYSATEELTIANFLDKEDSKDVYYRLTGTITSIVNPVYGNINITDASGSEVLVYGLLPGYGATGDAKKGLVEAKGLKEGDTITILGNKASFKGTAQVGNAIYVSHTSAN